MVGDVDDELALLLELSKAEDLSTYLAKGRYLKHHSLDALAAFYVQAIRDWADADGAKAASFAVFDAASEYELRQTEPPDDLIANDMKRIGEAMARHVESMDSDDHDQLATNLGRRLDDIKGNKQ